jgi:hypothetical protein
LPRTITESEVSGDLTGSVNRQKKGICSLSHVLGTLWPNQRFLKKGVKMSKHESNKKRYEKPVLIPLGELATSMGAECVGGSSAGQQCYGGDVANALCQSGTIANAACNAGGEATGVCSTGGTPGGNCSTGTGAS